MFSNKKLNILIWTSFHILIAVLFLVFGKLKINTSLYSILPETSQSKKLSEVESMLTESFNSSLMVLIGSSNFETAKEVSYKFRDDLLNVSGLKNISLELDDKSLGQIQRHLHKYRHHFLTDNVKELISNGDISSLSERAFFTITSPVSMGYLDNIDTDPFMLSYESFQNFLNSGLMGNMSLNIKDSLLTRDLDGISWILITLDLDNAGVVSNSNNNPISSIYNLQKNIENDYPGTEFVFSGVPFHTFESTKESKSQISLLSTISTVFIFLLILFSFRSLKPLISTIVAISFGMFTGFIITLVIFKEIHIFTIVFGTSLIGISVDYCFHFFTEWVNKKVHKDNIRVVKYILPGITVGLITTLISYGAFIISPFPLLQQIALFSIAGLLSCFITVILLFPVIGSANDKTIKRNETVSKKLFSLFILPSKYRKVLLPIISVIFIIVLILGLKDIKLNNNIRALYKISDKLLSWEIKSSEILEHGSSGLYMIVEGKDLEENLKVVEKASIDLDKLIKEYKLKSFFSLSTLLPSQYTQQLNIDLIESKLSSYVENQLEFVGFDSNAYNIWEDAFIKDSINYMSLDDIQSLPVGSVIDKINIGKVGSGYYSAIQLFGVEDIKSIEVLSNNIEGLYLVNKVQETNDTLQELSLLAIIIISFSYCIIFVGLMPRYGIKSSLKIVMIPLVSSLITLSIVNILGYEINIFVIVGMILIPGMGTDYLILITESKNLKPQVVLSITLSLATTVLSFGLLGFTSIAGTFGLTVALGVFITYFLTSIFSDFKK